MGREPLRSTMSPSLTRLAPTTTLPAIHLQVHPDHRPPSVLKHHKTITANYSASWGLKDPAEFDDFEDSCSLSQTPQSEQVKPHSGVPSNAVAALDRACSEHLAPPSDCESLASFTPDPLPQHSSVPTYPSPPSQASTQLTQRVYEDSEMYDSTVNTASIPTPTQRFMPILAVTCFLVSTPRTRMAKPDPVVAPMDYVPEQYRLFDIRMVYRILCYDLAQYGVPIYRPPTVTATSDFTGAAPRDIRESTLPKEGDAPSKVDSLHAFSTIMGYWCAVEGLVVGHRKTRDQLMMTEMDLDSWHKIFPVIEAFVEPMILLLQRSLKKYSFTERPIYIAFNCLQIMDQRLLIKTKGLDHKVLSLDDLQKIFELFHGFIFDAQSDSPLFSSLLHTFAKDECIGRILDRSSCPHVGCRWNYPNATHEVLWMHLRFGSHHHRHPTVIQTIHRKS